jgi:hypothetical protein
MAIVGTELAGELRKIDSMAVVTLADVAIHRLVETGGDGVADGPDLWRASVSHCHRLTNHNVPSIKREPSITT